MFRLLRKVLRHKMLSLIVMVNRVKYIIKYFDTDLNTYFLLRRLALNTPRQVHSGQYANYGHETEIENAISARELVGPQSL